MDPITVVEGGVTDLPRDELLGLARQLGADVPFAFTGGTAIGTGRGDELSPALAQGTFQWVLAIADFGLSTPAVYRELDEHRARHAGRLVALGQRPVVERVHGAGRAMRRYLYAAAAACTSLQCAGLLLPVPGAALVAGVLSRRSTRWSILL